MVQLSSQALRIIKTCVLYSGSISSGIAMAVVGPCLLEFQEIVHTDAEHRAFIYTARSIGYLVGCLLGGVLFDLTEKKQFLMTILNFLVAFSMFAAPWSRTVSMLIGWFVLSGLSTGALDTGLNVCCLNLWGKDCGPFYQALHFMYSFGSLLAPLIVAPFLGDYHHETFINGTSSLLNETSTNLSFTITSSDSPSSEIPSLTYAFSIIGGYAFLVSICFLVVCIIAPIDKDTNKSESTETKQPSIGFVTIIVILGSILLFVEIGTEIGYAQMIATYSVKGPLHLTQVDGSYITSAFWSSLTISRLSAVFMAIKCSSLVVIQLDLIAFFVGAVVLQLFSASGEWALWTASIFLGFGTASLYASLITWMERYITITNKLSGIFATAVAFGEMVIPYIIGYFLEKFPDILSYVVTVSCVFSILLTFIMYLILRTKQQKYVEKKEIPKIACIVVNDSGHVVL